MLQKNLEKHSDMLSGFNLAFDILTENRDNNMFVDSNNNLTRDVIFDNILQQVKPNPINIFQVGAIETFNPSWRIGSGWSDTIFGKYMREYGGIEKAKQDILHDFFRFAFDGSGGSNDFDAGSCIDGRLTSAWNWCSKLEKKPYYNVFMFTGFQGFDGIDIFSQ